MFDFSLPTIENWAFAQIPTLRKDKFAIALIGKIDGRFADSWPLASVSRSARTATDIKGRVYSLGQADEASMAPYSGDPVEVLKQIVAANR